MINYYILTKDSYKEISESEVYAHIDDPKFSSYGHISEYIDDGVLLCSIDTDDVDSEFGGNLEDAIDFIRSNEGGLIPRSERLAKITVLTWCTENNKGRIFRHYAEIKDISAADIDKIIQDMQSDRASRGKMPMFDVQYKKASEYDADELVEIHLTRGNEEHYVYGFLKGDESK